MVAATWKMLPTCKLAVRGRNLLEAAVVAAVAAERHSLRCSQEGPRSASALHGRASGGVNPRQAGLGPTLAVRQHIRQGSS